MSERDDIALYIETFPPNPALGDASSRDGAAYEPDPRTVSAAAKRFMALEEQRHICYSREESSEEKAVRQFLWKNPKYIFSDKNRDALWKYLTEHGLSITVVNLQTAFDELRREGKMPEV